MFTHIPSRSNPFQRGVFTSFMMSNSSTTAKDTVRKHRISVHWKSILCVLLCAFVSRMTQAQETTVRVDSTEIMILGDPAPTPQEKVPREKVLEAIVTAGGGAYQTYRDGIYKTLIQPTGSLDFYLEPGGIGFILGGHFGFADFFTQGISFGIRERIDFLSLSGFDSYTEISVLFFDDKAFARSFETGVRLALSSVLPQNKYGYVLRLAGEYRGRVPRTESTETLRPLYWVGFEGGVNFSLLQSEAGYSRRDSVRAAIRHILTSNELDDFDQTAGGGFEPWYERYWKEHDPTPTTPLNEAREEFESRARYANAQFSQLKRMGVDTDRGRVAIVYGRPSYVQLGQPEGVAQQAYQLWVYENRVKGYQGALFLFESSYSGDYRQIYSNVIGETTGALPTTIPGTIYRIIERYDP